MVLKRTLLFISYVIFLMSGILLQTENYSNLTNYFIVIPTIIILLIALLNNSKEFKLTYKPLDIIYSLFAFWAIVSSIVNADSDSFFSGFKFVIFYLVLILVPKNLNKIIDSRFYISMFTIASIIGLLITVLDQSFYFGISNFKGIFDNPNNLGVFASIATIILIYQAYISIVNNNVILSIFYIIVTVFAFYLVVVSASRTAFISLFVVLIVTILANLNVAIKSGKINKNNIFKFIFYSVVITVAIIVFFNSPLYEAIQDNIISKSVSRGDNITSGRTTIWKSVIESSKILGLPSGFIKDTLGFSAHNSFLSIIGQFGWISGLFYTLFWFIGFIMSYFFFIRNKKVTNDSLFILIMVTVFIAMSMMEVLTHTFAMYVALFSLGLCQNKFSKS